MKHYFKYDAGYINLDTDNLYLTSSGNWQEARGLKEKSPATKAANNFRITRMKFFVFIVFGAITIALFTMLKNAKLSISLTVGMGVLAYYLFKSFKSDFGKRYKIPLSKIEKIEEYEKGLKITFRNEKNESDFEIIDNVDPVGIEMLKNFKIIIFDSVNTL